MDYLDRGSTEKATKEESGARKVEGPERGPGVSRNARAAPPVALIVDDNVDLAKALGMLFKLWGYKVQIRHDGWSALDAARNAHPDVVLLDIGLPGLDGYQVAEQLRKNRGSKHAMLIAMTGFGRFEENGHAGASVFNHRLLKPVSSGVLRQLLP